MVFARLYYGGPLLGVVLAVARECKPPSFNVCLPCNACISGGFSGCFAGFYWLVLVFLGRVQQELLLNKNKSRFYLYYILVLYILNITIKFLNLVYNISF